MGKLIKLTEEQYKKALQEGLVTTTTTTERDSTGNPKQEVEVKTNGDDLKTQYDRLKRNVKNPQDFKFVIDDKSTNESYVISRSDLTEHRRKTLEKYTKTYTVEEFLNRINK